MLEMVRTGNLIVGAFAYAERILIAARSGGLDVLVGSKPGPPKGGRYRVKGTGHRHAAIRIGIWFCIAFVAATPPRGVAAFDFAFRLGRCRG
jgi:hypothetical protein